jgi:hypothetical protein
MRGRQCAAPEVSKRHVHQRTISGDEAAHFGAQLVTVAQRPSAGVQVLAPSCCGMHERSIYLLAQPLQS